MYPYVLNENFNIALCYGFHTLAQDTNGFTEELKIRKVAWIKTSLGDHFHSFSRSLGRTVSLK